MLSHLRFPSDALAPSDKRFAARMLGLSAPLSLDSFSTSQRCISPVYLRQPLTTFAFAPASTLNYSDQHVEVASVSRLFHCFKQLLPTRQASSRKEVIQPHLPVRLPCYDFVPVIRPTLGSSSLAVRSPTSGVSNSHDVTGGVYKARERIHRSMADLRLLATPASCRRVAAYNLNYERL